jgi:XTP/dITP diphosphohydrolase
MGTLISRAIPVKLLIGTGNAGKIAEFRSLLRDLPLSLAALKDFPHIPEIRETGETFKDNAWIKAVGYAKASGLHALADDSGLEVESLGGAPGVRSARFAGTKATYEEKIAKLLASLQARARDNRNARFVSHIVLANPDGNVIFEAEGVCQGTVAEAPRGINGFGYDPIFIPAGFTETFGEHDQEVKQRISHRAVAIGKIIRFLRDFA